jgi:redox-sensitive bicupin YhaK (pirin superfamily)
VVAKGRVRAGDIEASEGELILFANDGDQLELTALESSHVIVLPGEPIVQYGPFVMNTFDEIPQAFVDVGGQVRACPGMTVPAVPQPPGDRR